MSLWNGSLRNSPRDIAVDITFLIAIPITYLPQIIRIRSHGSRGISPYFLLFNVIYENIQFAHSLLFASYSYPTDGEPVLKLIGDGRLRGSAALGGILGLLQVALNWGCSVTFLLIFAFYSDEVKTPGVLSGRSSNIIATTSFVHAAILLLPAMMIAFPKPSSHGFGTDLFVGFSLIVNTWVALFFILFLFYPQYLEFRRMSGKRGALSLISIGLQAFVLLAVAARWLLRLGRPTWGDQRAPLNIWYHWGALPFNYILNGIGCMILLAAYLLTESKGETHVVSSEVAPLLT